MAGPRRRSRPAPVAASSDHERALLRHDLEVHQEELRAQNQKLIEALHELEETRDRFIELYDGAPNGYCTLDGAGVVREINLTGAALLGQSRAALVGSPLLPSIVAADRGRFLGYLRISAHGINEATGGEEVHVHTAHGRPDAAADLSAQTSRRGPRRVLHGHGRRDRAPAARGRARGVAS